MSKTIDGSRKGLRKALLNYLAVHIFGINQF